MLLLHVFFGLALYTSFAPSARPRSGEALQVLEVELINVPPPVPAPEPEPSMSPPPSRTADAESPSAFIASGAAEQSRNPPAPVPVIDALDFDARALTEACVHAYPETAADLRRPGTLTLLVKVEASGRPSELKVVVSSGSSDLDQAAGACLMALGSLPPSFVDGRRVAGWQRVVWPRLFARPRE